MGNYIIFSAEPVTFDLVSSLIVPSVVVIVLVLANGFFVAAEFAMLAARASRMEALSEEGNHTATKILAILTNPNLQNRYLATNQLGITVITLALSMYAEPQFAHLVEPALLRFWPELPEAVLHSVATVLTLGVLTYLHIVIGEMVPKALALNAANEIVLQLHRPISLIERLFTWPIKLLNLVGNVLLQAFRIPPEHGHARLYSSEEIEQIVSESTEGGLMAEQSEELIANIFDFRDREVGHVMTPRRKIEGIPLNISQEELLRVVTSSRHSRFPVYENDLDHIVGILHLKDFAQTYIKETFVSLSELLRPTPVVPYDHSVQELLKAFKADRIHMAIVLDEFGGVAGIVTLEDLVEEIVGEIRDEFDIEREPYVEIAPGILELAGDYLLEYLHEEVYLGEDQQIPDVATVGGFVVTHLGRPPRMNDVVKLSNNVVFTVIGVDSRAVTRVRVEFPSIEKVNQGNNSKHGEEQK